ncbi:beta-ketoacyl-ACP synthase III [uncultured Clostridium sp.]|uniref:beta-ketoacyl-ACP synthase III n=1 Tax=uncultured Clostridium sp. TaxID=59620 RepID=UPI0028EDF567|nr:beta-ketoacyl-ACP synthase III [uncultured Clostridium sp.]
MIKKVKILGTGSYLPERIVTSDELDKKLGVESGWTFKHSGISNRHFATNETASQMGAYAIENALKNANLTVDDIDCIVCASASLQQPVPCTATFIQRELGWEQSKIPCFDISSVCLSFVVAFDIMSSAIETGRYKNVILVSTEILSHVSNWDQKESCILLGDGAAAVIIGQSTENETSKILSARMETYSEGANFAEIRGGGTKIHSKTYSKETKSDFYFDMHGKNVTKLVANYFGDFVKKLLTPTDISLDDIDIIIPHQASDMSMKVMQIILNGSEKKFINILNNRGNMAAASIPLALHESITQGKIKRGYKVMLIGGGAGFSLGGIVFEY